METKITDLAEVTAPLLTDRVVVNIGGVTKTCLLSEIQALCVGANPIATLGPSTRFYCQDNLPATCNKGDFCICILEAKLYYGYATNNWQLVGSQ